MKATLRYKAEVIGQEGLPSGEYQIRRGSGKGVGIFGPCFGENGTIFAEPDTTVSRKHLLMNVADNSITLRDEGSSNGSYLNDERFDRKEISDLGTYKIRLGCFSLELVLSE